MRLQSVRCHHNLVASLYYKWKRENTEPKNVSNLKEKVGSVSFFVNLIIFTLKTVLFRNVILQHLFYSK